MKASSTWSGRSGARRPALDWPAGRRSARTRRPRRPRARRQETGREQPIRLAVEAPAPTVELAPGLRGPDAQLPNGVGFGYALLGTHGNSRIRRVEEEQTIIASELREGIGW